MAWRRKKRTRAKRRPCLNIIDDFGYISDMEVLCQNGGFLQDNYGENPVAFLCTTSGQQETPSPPVHFDVCECEEWPSLGNQDVVVDDFASWLDTANARNKNIARLTEDASLLTTATPFVTNVEGGDQEEWELVDTPEFDCSSVSWCSAVSLPLQTHLSYLDVLVKNPGNFPRLRKANPVIVATTKDPHPSKHEPGLCQDGDTWWELYNHVKQTHGGKVDRRFKGNVYPKTLPHIPRASYSTYCYFRATRQY